MKTGYAILKCIDDKLAHPSLVRGQLYYCTKIAGDHCYVLKIEERSLSGNTIKCSTQENFRLPWPLSRFKVVEETFGFTGFDHE